MRIKQEPGRGAHPGFCFLPTQPYCSKNLPPYHVYTGDKTLVWTQLMDATQREFRVSYSLWDQAVDDDWEE